MSPDRRCRVASGAAAAAAFALLIAACGDSPAADDQTGPASSPSGPSSTIAETTAAPVGTPFPEGVYQWSLTPGDWEAAGLPADTEDDVEYHVVTFTSGTVYDIAILDDGTRVPSSRWNYASTDDHEVTFSDPTGAAGPMTLRWTLSGDELTFTMDGEQTEPGDRALWTSRPLVKVG